MAHASAAVLNRCAVVSCTAHEADALSHVAGYCVINDVSEREFQIERQGQWSKGKGCDNFGQTGPWLVTPDEIDDPQDNDASQLFLGAGITTKGQIQSYDNSGYETLFQVDFLHETLRNDIPVLRKASWIDGATRMVSVDFLLYNGNFDYFIAVQFLVEFPAIGVAVILRASTW